MGQVLQLGRLIVTGRYTQVFGIYSEAREGCTRGPSMEYYYRVYPQGRLNKAWIGHGRSRKLSR